MTSNIFSEEMEKEITKQIFKIVQESLNTLTDQKTKQEFFRPDEASKYCGASVKTIERWEELGLKYSKVRNIKLYSKNNLDLFILSHEI